MKRANMQHSLYLCPDVSHGEPFLLRASGVAGSRGFSPTALIFSFDWPVEEEHAVKQQYDKQSIECHVTARVTQQAGFSSTDHR